MSLLRLYVDEDAAEHAVVEALRDRGIDVLTVSEAAMDSETDESQLLLAAAQNRSLYTLNVGDYCDLHKRFLSEGKGHAGIIVIPRQRYSIGEKLRRLIRLASSVTAEEMRDRLEFL
ncbi:MAG TPA: DUF5615 family PIN-like protein [Pirellulales bacterium]